MPVSYKWTLEINPGSCSCLVTLALTFGLLPTGPLRVPLMQAPRTHLCWLEAQEYPYMQLPHFGNTGRLPTSMATSAKLRGLGGSRAAVGRVWDCKVADPGVVTRRARDCGRRGLPGDRLYRTGSGLAGQAGYPGMRQW